MAPLTLSPGMAQNVVISLIRSLFVSNFDTKKIFERSSHWKYKIIPPPELDLINHLSSVLNFCALQF